MKKNGFKQHCLAILAALLVLAGFPCIAETGVSDDDIFIGQSAALAGPASELGTEMRLGAQVYFKRLNQKGGVHGRKVRMVTLDDGYEPARAVANTQRFIDEYKVFALFGYVGASSANSVVPLVTKAQIPFFAPVTGAQVLRTPVNRYVFNIRASDSDEAGRIVEQLVLTARRRIAVLHENNDFGRGGLDAVTAALARHGLQAVSTGMVETNSMALTPAVASILAGKPDAVIMLAAYASGAEFVRRAKQAGFAGQFYNMSFVGSAALAAELGKDGLGVAVSQVVPLPWSAGTSIAREYQKAMAEDSPAALSFSSMEGYIAAKVFVEGLRRAGRQLTREKLIAAFDEMSAYDIGGFTVGFSPTQHSGSAYVDLTIVGRDGKFMK